MLLSGSCATQHGTRLYFVNTAKLGYGCATVVGPENMSLAYKSTKGRGKTSLEVLPTTSPALRRLPGCHEDKLGGWDGQPWPHSAQASPAANPPQPAQLRGLCSACAPDSGEQAGACRVPAPQFN